MPMPVMKNRTSSILALTAAVITLAFSSGPRVAAQTGGVIAEVRVRVAQRDFAGGERVIADHHRAYGVTSQSLEAMSWMGRGALALQRWAAAERYARDTYDLSVAQLKGRPLDADPYLPIALGAAIEVLGQVQVARDARSEAVAFLEREANTYRNTSIATRIQKNLNLVSLVGTTAPALDLSEYLGPRPASLAALKGKVIVMFFWAHWCADCKIQGPVLDRLLAKYAARGLIIVAPTQRYGYVAAGRDAAAADERLYIEQIRRVHYPALASAAVPLASSNHRRYGVSTTPTLVVVDRAGVVRLYHPGRMTDLELEPLTRDLINR